MKTSKHKDKQMNIKKAKVLNPILMQNGLKTRQVFKNEIYPDKIGVNIYDTHFRV